MRALSIAGVMLAHTFSSGAGTLWPMLRRGGYGVDVFFVLSGFLITWILAAEMEHAGRIDLPRFYWRRALRIQPAYFSALLLFFGAMALFSDAPLGALMATLPLYLTYSFNFALPYLTATPLFVVAWSLCIEEQFYFLWPWTLNQLTLRRALRAVLWMLGALMVYRAAVFIVIQPSGENALFSYRTDMRIDPILVGCALALWLRGEGSAAVRGWIAGSAWFPSA